MVIELLRRIMQGLGWSALITFAALTGLMLHDTAVQVSVIWENMLGSMIMAVYFGAASYIFEYEKWSPLKQLIIHFLLSILLFFPVSITVGWIPLEPMTILLGLLMFVVTYAVFWLSFRYYFKKQAEAMNASVNKNEK